MNEADRARQRALFEEYRLGGDRAIGDQLVRNNLGLANHLARRFSGRGVSDDDLLQVASVGLVKAIERYEPDRGTEFSTFATPTILGELKRHFRDKSWAIRVPRRVQELHLRLNALVGSLTQELGRSPTIAELASATRTSEEEVLEAIEAANAYRTRSTDQVQPGEDGQVHSVGADDANLVRSEERILVTQLLEVLEPREQLVVRLRFYEEMTQAEIAQRLGISQMHVSRLLSRSLDRLREDLET